MSSPQPDMSGFGYWNLAWKSDMSGWGLSCYEERLGRTCSVQESDMSGNSYWNLAQDSDKSG
jgi:hypothetical protein